MSRPNFRAQLVNKIKSRCIITESGCWIWQGGFDSSGYGHISVFSKMIHTHKILYELVCGRVPAGKEIDHKCKNILCCNPEHLEAVTHIENLRRAGLIKLSLEQAMEIRLEVAKWHPTKRGNLYEQLAAKYGISKTHVSQIATNKR